MTDSVYLQGSSHLHCEDFAATQARRGQEMAALSDGCSSAKYPVDAAMITVRSLLRPSSYSPSIQAEKSLRAHAHDFKIPFEEDGIRTLLATAAQLVWDKTPYNTPALKASLVGDGVVGWVDGEGRISGFEIDYDDAPYYPAYGTAVEAKEPKVIPFGAFGEEDYTLCGLSNTLEFRLSEGAEGFLFAFSDGIWTSSRENPLEEALALKTSGEGALNRRLRRMHSQDPFTDDVSGILLKP